MRSSAAQQSASHCMTAEGACSMLILLANCAADPILLVAGMDTGSQTLAFTLYVPLCSLSACESACQVNGAGSVC